MVFSIVCNLLKRILIKTTIFDSVDGSKEISKINKNEIFMILEEVQIKNMNLKLIKFYIKTLLDILI